MNNRMTSHVHFRCYDDEKQAFDKAARETTQRGEISEYFRKLHREDVARRHQKLKRIRGEG